MTAPVCLHAFPLDGSMWGGLGEPVDYPGSGTLADWADVVAARIERPALVCGLSMGGYAAFELWRRHPSAVSALILADTKPGADTAEQRRGRDEAIAVVRAQGVPALYEQMVPALFSPEPDPAAVERGRIIAGRQSLQRVVAMLEALRDRHDSHDLLATIDVPVTVICGAGDALSPPSLMREMAIAIPGARYVEIAGAGHLSVLERPEAFAAAVQSAPRSSGS